MDNLEKAEIMLESAKQLLEAERRVAGINRGRPVTELYGEMLVLYNQGLIMAALRVLLGGMAQDKIDAVRNAQAR
jgi:actin-like ATPase involved in cell morphogenesis